MKRGYREDWRELARREPYYAVLTDRRFLRENLDDDGRREFFASGDADVEALLATIAESVDRPFAPSTALDFGCGVGRLTLPLARRVPRVVGCDIAPDMVAEARRNASALGVGHATFVTSLDEVSAQRFDLICSLIVFQHIPVREGLATLSDLLGLLAPGAVVAIHFPIRRPGSIVRRLARRARAAMPFVHRVAQRLAGDSMKLPYMQMNAYDVREVVRCFVDVTGLRPVVVPRDEGEIAGALFIGARAT
ncbi:MAG: class I SAM-dependent methyltransferase [Thermoanaerobaculia bacterium]